MEVWHVRHGERCDEVSGPERRAWESSNVYRQGGAHYDPPLTKHGHVQASRAGIYIKSLLSFDLGRGRNSTSGFDRVYVSPLMRAVQTAVCISQALGNLPLQVVPGLCSCTAALARIGYERAELIMTDADIVAAFPGVNLIPRDPLTPTSFRGAQAWLAARPDRRVLAVGHREGTKAMAGRRVPTPHCCIGIFKVDRADKSYTLRHLLSHAGEPLESKQPRRLLRRREKAGNDGEEGAEALAARVIALSVTPNHCGSSDSPGVKPAKPRHPGPETAAPRPRGGDARTDSRPRAARKPPATTADDHTAVDTLDRLSSGAGSAERKPRGTPPTPLATVGKPKGGADGEIPAGGARSAGVASGASGETRVKPGDRTLPTTAMRVPPKPTGGVVGAADGYGQGSSSGATASVTLHGKAGDAVGDDRTARPPPLSERRRHAHDDPAAAAPAVTAPTPAAAAPTPAAAAATGAASKSGGGDADLEGRRRPVTSAVATPARGGCAGRGFRVAALSRRSVSGAGSASMRHPGVAVGVLSGPMGVLSFLSPFELCASQAVCKDVAVATTSDQLWIDIFNLLPGRRRVVRGEEVGPLYPHATAAGAEGAPDSKALFVSQLSTIMTTHAAQASHDVVRSKRRSRGIYYLRLSVDKIRMKLSVRLNGEPASLVDTRGTKTEAWASRGNLLGEPSSFSGVRRFSLSSSAKVRVPEELAPSEVLPSLSVAWSWREAWSPRVTMVKTDRPVLLSQARLLGKSSDGGVTLYEVPGLGGPGARSCGGGGGGGSGSSGGGGSGGGRARGRGRSGSSSSGGGGGGRSSGGGGGNSVLPSTKRACALLGVFNDAEQAGRCPSGRAAFLTVHFPHDLLIDAATGRFRSERPPGTARFRENEPVFSVALGLRTAGVPLWEKACYDVSARPCSRYGARYNATCLRGRPSGSEAENRSVMRIDLVQRGANDLTEVTLSGGLGLPYSTSGGLQGVVEDVLLADFVLCTPDFVTLWAFASPIVFETSPKSGSGSSSGGGSYEDDGSFDIAFSEARAGRRRGFVVEPGVGRVIVELALVETFDGSGSDIGDKAAARNKSCPPGHDWIVRAARVELELSFVNAWVGPDVVD